jgi:hypothetical protein
MHIDDERAFALAHLSHDVAVLGDSALHADFDEARFRAGLIAEKAEAAGLVDVVKAAKDLAASLGPVGTQPGLGYGVDILRVADELDKVGFQRLRHTRRRC